MTEHLTWTEEQGRAYEQAREVMNNYLGMVHSEIYAEEERANPRVNLIRVLGQYAIDITTERDHLDIVDDAAIAATIKKHSALVHAIMHQ